MVPSPPSNHLAIQQFLSTVLSQRGPSALPYSEDTKWLIRQHLLSLTTTSPSLEPKTATFTHNDGRTVNLLQADGTVPIAFVSVTYNIPVIIWLTESYPRHPPCVYVNPTRDMIIKRSHPFVNPSGLVSVPYLQNWIYPSSNLVDLAHELSSVFGRDPPLFSQRTNPNPNYHPNQSSFESVGHTGGGSGGYPRPSVRTPQHPPPSPYGSGGGVVAGKVEAEDAAEVYKRKVINMLVENVHGDMLRFRKTREAEMENWFSAQTVLRGREEEVNKGLKEMRDKMEGLELHLQVVLTNTDVLEAWVRENKGKLKGGSEHIDVDNTFECVDVLSRQILECTAVDMAIEDVVYSLEKAVQEGAMPFDQYLRTVRLLSREQFFNRATAAKVRAAQMQAQVAGMAARAPRYAT